MTWEDRLRTAAYFPPDSPDTGLVFSYEDVSRETVKRTAGFEFPGVDGTYVQDNGFGAQKFPLRCYFSGDDHDLLATTFERALLQKGPGRLSHPLYGEADVVPFGPISRRDDLKTRANQTVIQVTFWETTKLVYPSNQLDARSQLEASTAEFISTTGPSQFEDTVDVSTLLAQGNLKATTQNVLSGIEATLGTVAAVTTEVNNLFRDAQDAINLSLDILVGQPLNLAQQLCNLIALPGRAISGFVDRVLGYRDFAVVLFGSKAGDPAGAVGLSLPLEATDIANDFFLTDLSAAAAVNGTLVSLLETEFETRTDAQAAADTVLQLFDDWVAWREAGYAALTCDVGTSYQTLQQSVALAAGLVVEISFTLLSERVLVLGRNRTIVDVASEVYGNVDDETLNRLINNNDLTGSQILELEKGDRIAYYG